MDIVFLFPTPLAGTPLKSIWTVFSSDTLVVLQDDYCAKNKKPSKHLRQKKPRHNTEQNWAISTFSDGHIYVSFRIQSAKLYFLYSIRSWQKAQPITVVLGSTKLHFTTYLAMMQCYDFQSLRMAWSHFVFYRNRQSPVHFNHNQRNWKLRLSCKTALNFYHMHYVDYCLFSVFSDQCLIQCHVGPCGFKC